MSMERYDELVKRRSELSNWYALRHENDFSQGRYCLLVNVLPPSMIAYCGQQYAGAKNYHDAPKWFGEVVRKAVSKQINAITRQAVEDEIASLTVQIEALKEQILAEFSREEAATV